MSRLIVESGNEEGMVYPLRQESVTIGRSASATIQVIDKRVSRHHVMLRRSRDAYVVEDLGSKNGSLLNGDPMVGRVKLKSGDRIQLGDTILVYERDPDDMVALGDTSKSSGVKMVPGEMGQKLEEVRIESSQPVVFATQALAREVLRDPFERIKVLYQVADSMRSELEIDELLKKIMDFLWTVLSPYRGIILLRDERDNILEPVVVRCRDGIVEEITISSSVVERCMSEQVAILVSDAPSDLRFCANESIIMGRIRSVICSPLVCKGEVLGALYIDSQDPGQIYYTNDELELVTGVANQAAIAITNARLHRQALERQKLEKELEIARTIQVNLLPKTYPEVPGVSFAAMSFPARKVGGDYYDFVPLEDGRIAIVIADVSGKGVPAAILTATIRASIRVEAHQPGSPPVSSVVSAINRWTCRDATNNMFVTMVYAVYDPQTSTIEYTNAGHCFPLLFKPNGNFLQLETGGCFLGIMEEIEYESQKVPVEPGDTLLFFTDGVIDTHNENNQVFGSERLVQLIRDNLKLSAEELRDEIYEATLTFRAQAEQFDDLTQIVVKF